MSDQLSLFDQFGNNVPIAKQIELLAKQEQELKVRTGILLDKAFKSDDPNAILKADEYYSSIQKRPYSNSKSYVFDPLEISNQFGYKDKPTQLSYATLRRMAKAPIIKSIIGTRIEQILDYCEPQTDKYSKGFVIRKKGFNGKMDEDDLTNVDKRKIQLLTDFIMNGGSDANSWHGDVFDSFVRKFMMDSLSLDQGTFEVVRNRRGIPVEFFATDGATFRIADTYDDDAYKEKEKVKINGYYPSWVQVYNSQIVAEFYPWELCFGIRNPTTNIYMNGYGQPELEDLIMTVTSMLNGDAYNSNFFKQGSAPKGILRVTGNINEARLAEFRQQWMAQVAGVGNAGRTPVIEAEKMDWVDLQKTNRDMEFTAYQRYLMMVSCSIYKISPEEIGFPAKEAGGLNEGSKEDLFEYSQRKGLKPLLKFLQRKINKYLIGPIDPEFEFIFTGMDVTTPEKELEMDIKAAESFEGLKEVRKRRGLPEHIDEDDIILNPTWVQYQQMQMMGNAESDQYMDEQGNVYDQQGNATGDKVNPKATDKKKEETTQKAEDNPFEKALVEWWNTEMIND